MKKIINCLTAAAIFCSSLGLTVFAADPDTVDFSSGTAGSAPTELGSIITKGAGSGTYTLLLESAVADRDASDLSAVLSSTSGLSKLKKIYAPLTVNDTVSSDDEYMLSFKLAAKDKNSSKVVSFDADGSDSSDPRNAEVIIDLNKDGNIYAFGTELCGYDANKWYGITVAFKGGSDKADVYVDGIKMLSGVQTANAISGVGNLYFGVTDKANTSDEASFCFDDIKLNASDIKAGIADFSCDTYSFSESDMTVQITDMTVTYALIRSAVTLGGGTTLTFLDSTDREIADESAVAESGSFVRIASADGSVILKFTIIKMGISIIEPIESCFRRPGETVTVKANAVADSIGSVILYMESDTVTLSQTLTEAPYEYTFAPTANGTYRVYAVLTDGSGNEATTAEDVTVTVKSNELPTVSFTNLSNGRVSYSGSIEDKITFGDTDGTVEYIEIYYNGELYATENVAMSSGAYSLSIPDVEEGAATVKVIAYDNEGASAEVTADMTLVFELPTVIYSNTFENNIDGIDFSPKGEESYTFTDAPGGGKAFALTLNAGSNKGPYFYERAYVAQAETKIVTLEYDVWVGDNGRMQGAILDASRNYYAQYDINKDGKVNGVLINTLKDAQGWLHIKHTMDTNRLNITITVNGTQLEQVQAYNSTPKLGECRISFFNNSTSSPCTIYMKNFKISTVEENTQVTKVLSYKDGVATDVTDTAVVDPKSNAIELTLSNEVMYTDILRNNIMLYENGTQLGLYNVAIGTLDEQSEADESARTKNKVTITFDRPLRGNTQYKLVLKKGINLRNGSKVLADIPLTFTTAPEDFDVLDWIIRQSGNEVTVQANVANNTTGTVSGKMVTAVYSNNMLVGSSVTPFSVLEENASLLTSNTMTLSSTENLRVYASLWDESNIELTNIYNQ